MSEPAHILVVDDHDEIRNSVSSYLERNGMRTSVAESAAEMDAQRARHSFDLIVLDVMMPGEDGLTACKRLRQECGTPVLMLTALGEDDDRIEGLEGGADDYLSKRCCHVNSPNLQVGKLFVDQAACAADFHASNASSRW